MTTIVTTGAAQASVESVTILEIPLAQLRESPMNARKNFDKDKLKELADSIRAKGVLTPLLVRPRLQHAITERAEHAVLNVYEILAGARRTRAAKLAGLAAVPCVVRDVDDTAALEIITMENLQREDLSELEEAQGFQALLVLGKYDVAELAKRVGKSSSYVYARVKLVELAPEARKALTKEEISAGQAILIARLQPHDQARAMKELAERRPMSVRETGLWIQQEIHLDLGKAPWAEGDALLVPKAGACTVCPKRTKNACEDPGCYEDKFCAHLCQVEKSADSRLVKISAHYKPVEQDVLGEECWEFAAAKSCPDATVGLVMESGWKNGKEIKRGSQVGVCVNPMCKMHHPVQERESSMGNGKTPGQKAKERKDRAVSDARTAAVGLIAAKMKWPLGLEAVRAIALAFLERTTHDARKLLAKSLGVWPKDGKTGNFDFQGKLEARVKSTGKDGLAGMLVAIGLMPTWGRWNSANYGGNPDEKKALDVAGKAVGVNVAFLEGNAIKAATEKAAAKKPEPKPKSQTAAKSKRKRGKP